MFTDTHMTDSFGEVRSFLLRERDKVLSEAEWRFRMRGYGYNVRKTDHGFEVAQLPKNEIIGTIED